MGNLRICMIAILALLIISCDDDDPDVTIDNPATYVFSRDGASTVSFSGQTARIGMAEELISGMKDFSVDEATLLEMLRNETASGGDANPFEDASLNDSDKSILSKVAASRDFFSSNTTEASSIKADFEAWIAAHISETVPNADTQAAEGQAGQIADGSSTRYVSAKGLEYNQAVNKGLIGALMADQMLNNYLGTAVLDEGENIADNDAGTVAEGKSYTNMEHKWDEAYGYLFGQSSNEASPIDMLNEDSFLNKYLARVEGDEDFAGIASMIYEAFKLGRAAIVAGDYETRDKQADIIKEEVSKVIAIRAVYYLQQGKNGIEAGEFGPAFHDLSEGYGFIYSLRFTRKPGSSDPYFSKSEVDAFIDKLEAGNGFWTITPEELDEMSNDIADEFDFTVAQAGS